MYRQAGISFSRKSVSLTLKGYLAVGRPSACFRFLGMIVPLHSNSLISVKSLPHFNDLSDVRQVRILRRTREEYGAITDLQ